MGGRDSHSLQACSQLVLPQPKQWPRFPEDGMKHRGPGSAQVSHSRTERVPPPPSIVKLCTFHWGHELQALR